MQHSDDEWIQSVALPVWKGSIPVEFILDPQELGDSGTMSYLPLNAVHFQKV
jgi:hypothetical protein